MKINEVIEDINWNKIKKIIKDNCSEILEIYSQTGSMLYHGERGDEGDSYFVSDKIKNRVPKDTLPQIQTIVDKHLSDAGFTALRSNSLFCSPNPGAANAYGKLFQVFPLNGFSYTWSCKIHDFYEDFDTYPFTIKTLGECDSEGFIKTYGYKNNDLKDALNSRNEILIHGKCLLINNYLFFKQSQKLIGYYND